MDKSAQSVATFNKMAQQYQDKYMDCSLYSHSIDKLCDYILEMALSPDVDQVLDVDSVTYTKPIFKLDIGCGPGNVSLYLYQQCKTWQATRQISIDICVYGFDLAEQMVALATANNPLFHYEVLDMRKVRNASTALLSNKYHFAICAFCFPYLNQHELKQFIADLPQFMANNSILFVSFMTSNKFYSQTQTSTQGNKVHMYFYPSKYVANLFRENGFEVIEQYEKDYLIDGVKQATDCFMYLKRLG
ncbi:class I SAM-dependent methyltransferase [Shewanella sp. MMG014]|uniref:methyltransferase domain-containing protein n=1 Tax=Shewanella sp. MMG014 TaxID=2822691 RepID=UPI001B3732B5|nr:class I SAM-dependent methyltransferase [Shewanella sp. MMG014]MBQ4891678.1 class I SAM-dependent methyltransferase [Shewanella sp. MMG014]